MDKKSFGFNTNVYYYILNLTKPVFVVFPWTCLFEQHTGQNQIGICKLEQSISSLPSILWTLYPLFALSSAVTTQWKQQNGKNTTKILLSVNPKKPVSKIKFASTYIL